VQVVDDELAADQGKGLYRVGASRHDLPPVRGCGIPGVDLHDASVRRLPVGEDDEAITGELGLEVRVDAGHHGLAAPAAARS